MRLQSVLTCFISFKIRLKNYYVDCGATHVELIAGVVTVEREVHESCSQIVYTLFRKKEQLFLHNA